MIRSEREKEREWLKIRIAIRIDLRIIVCRYAAISTWLWNWNLFFRLAISIAFDSCWSIDIRRMANCGWWTLAAPHVSHHHYHPYNARCTSYVHFDLTALTVTLALHCVRKNVVFDLVYFFPVSYWCCFVFDFFRFCFCSFSSSLIYGEFSKNDCSLCMYNNSKGSIAIMHELEERRKKN